MLPVISFAFFSAVLLVTALDYFFRASVRSYTHIITMILCGIGMTIARMMMAP